jgi:hypothetical protein
LNHPALGRALAENGLRRAQEVSKAVVLPQWDALFDQLAGERT